MTNRINTIDASGETAPWSPVGDTLIQVQGTAKSETVVELHGRADANAPFALVASIKVRSESFISAIKLTQVKLVWRGNKLGDELKVWSAE